MQLNNACLHCQCFDHTKARAAFQAQSRSLQLEEQIRDLCAENKGCRREIDAAYAEAAKANAVARKRELELTNEKVRLLHFRRQMTVFGASVAVSLPLAMH
jgi:hypothetical protein